MDLTDAAAKVAPRIQRWFAMVGDRGLADLIGRVARVQRPSIQADIGAEPVQLDKSLRGVVTFLAKRLEGAEPEFVDIAPMRLDVITDLRRRDNT